MSHSHNRSITFGISFFLNRTFLLTQRSSTHQPASEAPHLKQCSVEPEAPVEPVEPVISTTRPRTGLVSCSTSPSRALLGRVGPAEQRPTPLTLRGRPLTPSPPPSPPQMNFPEFVLIDEDQIYRMEMQEWRAVLSLKRPRFGCWDTPAWCYLPSQPFEEAIFKPLARIIT